MIDDKQSMMKEILYIRGRLDELLEIARLVNLDLHSSRVVNDRVEEYLKKLEVLDPTTSSLYETTRENLWMIL